MLSSEWFAFSRSSLRGTPRRGAAVKLRAFLLRTLVAWVAIGVAAAVWLPLVHLFFRPPRGEFASATGVAPRARQLLVEQVQTYEAQAEHARQATAMRTTNAEWDLMHRTFLVLALANMARRDAGQAAEYRGKIDRILQDTLTEEAAHDLYHFLMPYARDGAWALRPARSQFVDSEIALMLAARRMLGDDDRWTTEVHHRIDLMIARMEQSPVLCAESYPHECWLYCNTMALAAMALTDAVDGPQYRPFCQRWVQTAKEHLVDSDSGLLVSSFTPDGMVGDGPEGSSIWMSAHLLQLVDPDFATEQYRLARRALGVEVLGFAYAREWPVGGLAGADVDSGPIVPGLDVSAGSSGLALVGASAFGDLEYLTGLHATLDFAAFPIERDGGLRYAASNQVGDAVLLYSTALGPLWEEAQAGAKP